MNYNALLVLPAVDWDWYESTVRNFSFTAEEIGKTVATLHFEDERYVELFFAFPYAHPDDKWSGYFVASLYEPDGLLIMQYGGYTSLRDFEDFVFSVGDNTYYFTLERGG